jgi:hypothetical protein
MMAFRKKKPTKAKINNKGKIKVKKGSILALVLIEGKGCEFIWLDSEVDRFSLQGNIYFKQDQGTYLYGKKRLRVAVYLEGISVPIHHAHIEREAVTREIINRDTGKAEKVTINQIKGLKYDSAVIDMLLNRHLADEFTRHHMDLPNLLLIILMVVTIILGVINVIAAFVV